MRGRTYLLSVVILIFLLAFALHKHIRDLADVAQTWGSFDAHLQRLPSVIFNYPPGDNEPSTAAALAEPVPKIIHQIFLTQGHPNASLAKYRPAIDSCRALHPSWSHQLWSDANATAFITAHYPDLLPHYTSYRQEIQRANILRYALLHHFGGVYLDLDITCLAALDTPMWEADEREDEDDQEAAADLQENPIPGTPGRAPSLAHLPFLTPAAYPAGVNNAFILARPSHPLLARLLAAAPDRDLRWGLPYVENMLSTGCMFFSEIWDAYARKLEVRMGTDEGDRGGNGRGAGGVEPADRIYVLADADGRVEPHMLRGRVTTPLFAHGGASSWHGWDAAMIVTIGKYYRPLAVAGFAGGFLGVMVVVWRLRGRSAGLMRRRSVRALFGWERKSWESRHLMSEEA